MFDDVTDKLDRQREWESHKGRGQELASSRASGSGIGFGWSVAGGSFCISPGKKKLAGETPLEAVMPPHPVPHVIRTGINASHNNFLFSLTKGKV